MKKSAVLLNFSEGNWKFISKIKSKIEKPPFLGLLWNMLNLNKKKLDLYRQFQKRNKTQKIKKAQVFLIDFPKIQSPLIKLMKCYQNMEN